MAQYSSRDGERRRRIERRFRPGTPGPDWALDPRVLPSGWAAHHAHHAPAPPAPRRLGPAAEIQVQYAQFLADFRAVERAYVASLGTTSAAAANFESYIVNRTQLLAVTLVSYFNSLPIGLPRVVAPPHRTAPEGALQTYVYAQIVGSQANSLQQALLAIPLPTDSGSDLQIYDAAVANAVQQSLVQTLDGVRGIFARTLLIPGVTPAMSLVPATGTGSGGGTGTGSTTG